GILDQPGKRDHPLPASVRFRIITPQIQKRQMKDTLDLYSLRRMLFALHLDAASAVKDLQDVFFQLRQRQSFRYFAFGLILHQEFLQNGILRVEYTLLFQRIHIAQYFRFFLFINIHPERKSSFDSQNTHFPVFIQPDISQRIFQRMLDMVVHILGYAVAQDPSLKRHTLLDPVRFLLGGQIHAEYEHLASELDLILSRPDIQFSHTDIREQKLTDAFLCSRQRNLFLDPVCIFLRHRQTEQV